MTSKLGDVLREERNRRGMMNLEVFNNNEFGEVRVISLQGEPYAVGVDVAKALGYAKPSQAVIDHCKGIRKLGIPSPGGSQETNVIPEGDIYRLVIKAADQTRNPEIRARAARFEGWIFDEVIPSIRRHGMYATPQTVEAMLQDPDTMIKTLQALKAEREQRQALERKVEKDKPRVLFSQAVEASDSSILIGDLAKILRQNGVEVGQNRLFEWMRDNGYLVKSGSSRNMPTQYSMERGWFEVQKRVIQVPDSEPKVKSTTKVTGKGQLYFVNRFISDFEKAQ